MTQTLSNRPARTYITGRVTQWIRMLALTLTVLSVLTVVIGYAFLPDTVPVHFNFKGEADAWGSRGSVWLLVAFNVALVSGLTFLSHHPRVFNYPGHVTEENAQTLYRAGEQMMVWMSLALSVIFTGIIAGTLFDFKLNIIVLPGMIGLFVALIAGLARMIKI